MRNRPTKSSTAVRLLLLFVLLAFTDNARALTLDPAGATRHDIDRVALMHPGYTITVSGDGTVRVDFVLNQQGIPRREIESLYGAYPREPSRQARVARERSDVLLALVRSPEFGAVGPEYLAAPGTFAHAGHRVIMTLNVYAGSTLARRVTFDSSRKQDWPAPLRRTFDEVIRLGKATGPLPVGPFLD